MGLWQKAKEGYTWVDRKVFGSTLPGGAIPGVPAMPGIGSRVNPATFNAAPTPGANPGMPFTNVPGADAAPGAGRPDRPGVFGDWGRTGRSGFPTSGEGIGHRVGKFITDNPDLIATGVGAAASIYGARQAGQAEDKRLEFEREQMAADQALANRKLGLDEQTMQRQWDDAARERERRRQAYFQVLAARQGAAAPAAAAPSPATVPPPPPPPYGG